MFGEWGVVHYGERGGSVLIKDGEQLLWKWRIRPNGTLVYAMLVPYFIVKKEPANI